MKLRLLVVLMIAIAGILTSSSCTKKYICHCNIKYSGVAGLPDSSTKEFDITDTKSKAKTKCEGESTTKTQNYITTVEKCYLF